jgi:uncharacterized protein involved in type VI secretion and phage assembly
VLGAVERSASLSSDSRCRQTGRPALLLQAPGSHDRGDGPSDDDYAQLDDQGRYLVKMRFDESALRGDAASTRIRMMQPHAGSPEGFHFPLRKGTEVMIGFLGGVPDRPFIAGAVPDAVTPSPTHRRARLGSIRSKASSASSRNKR